MLPVNMVVEIQSYGFDALDTRIYPLLTRANRKLCATGAYPFTAKFATWTEVVATPGVLLPGAPTDIRAVRNMGMPNVQDNLGNLTYLRRDYIEKNYGYNAYLLADTPRHYNLWGRNATGGGNLFVWPYHTITTVYALDYHALPPVLGAGTTEAQMLLPDAYCDVLQNMVLAELARSDGDLDDAAKYDGWAKAGRIDMMNDFDDNEDTPNPILFTQDDFFDF